MNICFWSHRESKAEFGSECDVNSYDSCSSLSLPQPGCVVIPVGEAARTCWKSFGFRFFLVGVKSQNKEQL